MEWSELYHSENQPTYEDVTDFISSDLWQELNAYLQEAYPIQPKMAFSKCVMDKGFWKGWNIKYQKSSKAICTLYPKQGYFIAMVVIGAKEIPEADLIMSICTTYKLKLYQNIKSILFLSLYYRFPI